MNNNFPTGGTTESNDSIEVGNNKIKEVLAVYSVAVVTTLFLLAISTIGSLIAHKKMINDLKPKLNEIYERGYERGYRNAIESDTITYPNLYYLKSYAKIKK